MHCLCLSPDKLYFFLSAWRFFIFLVLFFLFLFILLVALIFHLLLLLFLLEDFAFSSLTCFSLSKISCNLSLYFFVSSERLSFDKSPLFLISFNLLINANFVYIVTFIARDLIASSRCPCPIYRDNK